MSNAHRKEFEDRFSAFQSRIVIIAKKYARLSGVAQEEFESALAEEFWRRYQDYDVTRLDNFISYMQTALVQRALKVGKRKEREYQQQITSIDAVIEDCEGEDAMTPDVLVAATDVDKLVTDRLFICDLLEGEDEITRAIVEAKLREPNDSNREIGRIVGVGDMTVARRLKKLGEKAGGMMR